MNRREAIRLLATGMALPLAPGSAMALLREARAVVGEQTTPGTLTPHQCATVKAMAEMIVPRTETPGAGDAGACEFIDLILTEWYEPEQRDRFLQGLADLDTRTTALFGKNFVDCSAAQQEAMLEELGEKMAEAAERMKDQPRRYRGALPVADQNFYYTFRRLTLTAYYTSEVGAAELNFEIIPDRYDGCAEMHPAKEGQEKG
jgi:glucoside 3-dehydrogenase (cytochrome c) hitch-hiker subunit